MIGVETMLVTLLVTSDILICLALPVVIKLLVTLEGSIFLACRRRHQQCQVATGLSHFLPA